MMSDEMENGDSKISDISEVQPPISEVQPPILPVDAQTPLEMSTVEMNNMYETLLDSKSNSNSYSSCNSSFEKLGSRSEANSNVVLDSKWDRLEVHRKLLKLQLQQLSKSCHSHSLLSPSRNLVNGRRHSVPNLPSNFFDPADTSTSPTKSYSVPAPPYTAPTSPIKKSSVNSSSNSTSPSSVMPPSSFIYDSIKAIPVSPTPQVSEEPHDATQRILEFLAHKVDLLAINVNTIQFNLNQITELIGRDRMDKVPLSDSVKTLDDTMDDKLTFLENKFDHYKISMNIELEALREVNENLKNKLESYISQESEREEKIKECFNSPLNVPNCIVDLQPIKDDLEKKILDLDVRLVEAEQYSRRENLIISGIPNSVKQKDLEQKVIDILGQIGVHIIPNDITACHRLYSPPGSEFPAKVIIRFYNRKVVNFCLDHKDVLQQRAYDQLRMNLRFYDSVCSKNQESLRICKWLYQQKKIHDYYLRNGFVKIVAHENGRPEKIKHPDFLRKKFVVPPTV